MSDKQKIINDIYFDRSGYGSKATTLKDARQKDKSITMDDVNEFFRKNVEIKRKPRGTNSFVAPHNNHTYQIDLFFISKDDIETTQKVRAGLVCIDVLSKYAVVVPIKSKETTDVVSGTMEALQKMGAKPKMIYTDDEKAIASSDFKQYVEDEGIELYRTRGHPAFSERFIRTFKDKLFKRVETDEKKGKDNIQSTDYILEIMLTYNNKDVHSATGQTPNEARKKKNEYKSVLNVSVKAKKEKMYPELNVGDKVKILRKKAITEKERTSHFLKGEYVVEEITTKLKQKYYKLTDYPRPLMRHDLLKVWFFTLGSSFSTTCCSWRRCDTSTLVRASRTIATSTCPPFNNPWPILLSELLSLLLLLSLGACWGATVSVMFNAVSIALPVSCATLKPLLRFLDIRPSSSSSSLLLVGGVFFSTVVAHTSTIFSALDASLLFTFLEVIVR